MPHLLVAEPDFGVFDILLHLYMVPFCERVQCFSFFFLKPFSVISNVLPLISGDQAMFERNGSSGRSKDM